MFQHLEWLSVAEFVQVFKYILLMALIESLCLSLVMVLIGGFVTRKMNDNKRRLDLMGVWAWGVSIFLAVDQYLRFIVPPQGAIYQFLTKLSVNRVFLGVSPWLAFSALAAGCWIGGFTLLLHKEKPFIGKLYQLFDNSTLLMYIYIFFDIVTLGLVLYDNIFLLARLG